MFLREGYWSVVFFSYNVFWFFIWVMVASENGLRNITFSIFWKNLSRISIISSSNVHRFTSEAIWDWNYPCGKSSNQNYIFLNYYNKVYNLSESKKFTKFTDLITDTALFWLSISSWISLHSLGLSSNLSISFRLSNLLA